MDATHPPITGIAADEKLSPAMIYTTSGIVRGQVITKESIRVNIWLRTQSAPEIVHLKNAQVITFTGPGPIQPLTFSDFFIPTVQILAFHTLPPVSEPLDYDETEKNRKMETVMAVVGNFRFNGYMRMSAQVNVATNLEVSRTLFISMYDVEISDPYIPNMAAIKVPMALVRMNQAAYGVK